MGLWSYGTGSIVFKNQVEDDYYLIEEIMGRSCSPQVFENATFSYIREASNSRELFKFSNMKNEKNGLKRDITEKVPMKIRAIHIMFSKESEMLIKEEFLNAIFGLHEVFPVLQASFLFENDLGEKDSIILYRENFERN